MTIPAKAFEAADQAGEDAYATGGAPEDVAKAAIKAAAPFIAAQALRDEAHRWDNDMAQNFEYRTYEIANEIEIMADKLDPQ